MADVVTRELRVRAYVNPKTGKLTLFKSSAEHCFYAVSWSEVDKTCIARVAEFPLLVAHGKTPEKALRELVLVVKSILKELAAERTKIYQIHPGEKILGKNKK